MHCHLFVRSVFLAASFSALGSPISWAFKLPTASYLSAQEVSTQSKIALRFPISVRQGVAVDQDRFYAISNTEILVCDKKKGEMITKWQPSKSNQLHRHFTHLNSGVVLGEKLYCAHSRYPIDPNDNTIEIWNLANGKFIHEQSLGMPRKHGSLTWIDRRSDGSWWMCYAVYGENKNRQTKLVQYSLNEDSKNLEFVEQRALSFPKQVVEQWGTKSCSGGSWGPDDLLYTTGHDDHHTHVLEIDSQHQLRHVRTVDGMGFFGQGIAWDRTETPSLLWGIEKRKSVSATYLKQF